MAIISKETWSKLIPKNEKNSITAVYKNLVSGGRHKGIYTDEEVTGAILLMEYIFDEEMFQSKLNIRTWKDVEKEHPEQFRRSNVPNPMFIPSQELRDKLLKKTMATYKIATLIELGYGGMITEVEWKDDTSNKFSIVWDEEDNCPTIRCHCSRNWADFISFHTKQQAEKFMSYHENVELVKQYHLCQ